MVQLGSGPVKYRHEIVADALDSGLSHPADVLAVVGDVFVSGVLAQLDVLVNRNAFDHVKAQSRVLNLLFQPGDALAAPNLAHRHVVNRCHDGLHPRNLTDIFQRYLVVFSIPSE